MAKLLVTPHTIVNGRMKQIWAFALVALLVAVISVASSTLLQAESEPTLNLSSLSITDQNGTAIDLGTFDSTVSAYSANVASTVESVTVAATADAGKDAYIYISPGNYVLPGSSRYYRESSNRAKSWHQHYSHQCSLLRNRRASKNLHPVR